MFKSRALPGVMCQLIKAATRKAAVKAKTAIISYQIALGGLLPPHIYEA